MFYPQCGKEIKIESPYYPNCDKTSRERRAITIYNLKIRALADRSGKYQVNFPVGCFRSLEP